VVKGQRPPSGYLRHLFLVLFVDVAIHSRALVRSFGIHNDYNLVGNPLFANHGQFLLGANPRLPSRFVKHSGFRFEHAETEWLIELGRPLGALIIELQSRLLGSLGDLTEFRVISILVASTLVAQLTWPLASKSKSVAAAAACLILSSPPFLTNTLWVSNFAPGFVALALAVAAGEVASRRRSFSSLMLAAGLFFCSLNVYLPASAGFFIPSIFAHFIQVDRQKRSSSSAMSWNRSQAIFLTVWAAYGGLLLAGVYGQLARGMRNLLPPGDGSPSPFYAKEFVRFSDLPTRLAGVGQILADTTLAPVRSLEGVVGGNLLSATLAASGGLLAVGVVASFRLKVLSPLLPCVILVSAVHVITPRLLHESALGTRSFGTMAIFSTLLVVTAFDTLRTRFLLFLFAATAGFAGHLTVNDASRLAEHELDVVYDALREVSDGERIAIMLTEQGRAMSPYEPYTRSAFIARRPLTAFKESEFGGIPTGGIQFEIFEKNGLPAMDIYGVVLDRLNVRATYRVLAPGGSGTTGEKVVVVELSDVLD